FAKFAEIQILRMYFFAGIVRANRRFVPCQVLCISGKPKSSAPAPVSIRPLPSRDISSKIGISVF
ncbi:TPA: hypothetical protein ACFOCD_002006, partial [Neisseria meningitidis]